MGRRPDYRTKLDFYIRPPDDAILWGASICWIQEEPFTLARAEEAVRIRHPESAYGEPSLRKACARLVKERLLLRRGEGWVASPSVPQQLGWLMARQALSPPEWIGWLVHRAALAKVPADDVLEVETRPEALPWLGKAYVASVSPRRFQWARGKLEQDEELKRLVREAASAVRAVGRHLEANWPGAYGRPSTDELQLSLVTPLYELPRGWPGDAPSPPSVRKRKGGRQTTGAPEGKRDPLSTPAALRAAAPHKPSARKGRTK